MNFCHVGNKLVNFVHSPYFWVDILSLKKQRKEMYIRVHSIFELKKQHGHMSTGTPPLTRFLGPEKVRVKVKCSVGRVF
mgnify:CR=1 FL=1